MSQIRVHINFAGQRSTVSIDRVLFELQALKLGHQPDHSSALPAVRAWLQERLPAKVGETGGRLKQASQGARVLLVESIADKKLSTRRDDWLIGPD